jgi:hypothetical protein
MSAESKAALMRKSRKRKRDAGFEDFRRWVHPWQRKAIDHFLALGDEAVMYIDEGDGTMVQFRPPDYRRSDQTSPDANDNQP